MEAGWSEVQDPAQLHRQFETSLIYSRLPFSPQVTLLCYASFSRAPVKNSTLRNQSFKISSIVRENKVEGEPRLRQQHSQETAPLPKVRNTTDLCRLYTSFALPSTSKYLIRYKQEHYTEYPTEEVCYFRAKLNTETPIEMNMRFLKVIY